MKILNRMAENINHENRVTKVTPKGERKILIGEKASITFDHIVCFSQNNVEWEHTANMLCIE